MIQIHPSILLHNITQLIYVIKIVSGIIGRRSASRACKHSFGIVFKMICFFTTRQSYRKLWEMVVTIGNSPAHIFLEFMYCLTLASQDFAIINLLLNKMLARK